MPERLREYLQSLAPQGIALAYSGGVDSTLLLAVLAEMKQKRPFPFAALTMQTVLQDGHEMAEAAKLAEKYGVGQKILTFDPFSLPEVRHNRTDRCYHCKKAIFSRFKDYARTHSLKYLLDGTNADDLNVYRPGRKALQELGVISPLAELGITKAEIRRMSAELGLSTASKPAVPCLATRFQYNTLLDDGSVRRVAEGERLIADMFPAIKNIRLRVHRSLARLEVSAEDISPVAASAKIVAEKLKALGFDYVTLDLEGFRSGSFDIHLKGKKS